jgi:SAM-dependent methyltransferase/glycosyltransferase involved in cell wall biosynthesis
MLYESKIDLSVKNNSHTLAYDAITSLLNDRQGRILEVGCSSGYFGASLRACGHVVWGIEPNQSAAHAAQKLLDHVYEGFIQSFFNDYPDERFDAIVFGDVLEHLVDPVSVLQKCREFLSASGRVVASIPNVSHLAIRTMLAEGRWDYGDLGILDRTHLRFFTRGTAIDMFSDAGYLVHHVSPVRLQAQQVDALCHLGLNQKMLYDVSKLVQDDQAYDFQYVLSAEPLINSAAAPERNGKLKANLGLRLVCCLPDPEMSLAEIRLRQPLERWTTRFGGHVRIVPIYQVTLEDMRWGDIFVFQREATPQVLNLVNLLQSHGKKTIFEIDDLLCDLPHFLGHHISNFKQNRSTFDLVLRKSDAVTVTTERLADALREEGGQTFVVPNCAETHMSEVCVHTEVPADQVSLLVGSSDRILVDFLVPALLDIQTRLGVKIIAVGPPAQKLAAAGLVVQSHPNMSYHMFKSFVAAQSNCIGLIPLDNSRFSSCKSPIKYFDYSLGGIPSICSALPPYSDVIQDGANGFLCQNTSQAWIEHIEALVTDALLRQLLSREARKIVQIEFNMDIAAGRWNALIERLVPDVAAYRKSLTTIPLIEVASTNRRLSKLKAIMRTLFNPIAYNKAFDLLREKGPKALMLKILYFVSRG